MRRVLILALFASLVPFLRADGPQDNLVDKVRRVPPPGIKLSDEDRRILTAGRDDLGREIDKLRAELKGKPALLDLLPDVQIFYNAVHYALKYDEFFKPAEITVGRKLLAVGHDRAQQLRDGKPGWIAQTGLVVRGYVSKIDGSVQPYGLVVPATYRHLSPHQHRLDFWFHGRGELLSELNFLDGRMKSPGEFTPANAFVLHPYGRYCNANHFAGEIDALEALDHVKKHYPIDDNRIVVRGFSMGGAACWNYAVHYADRWVAAAPGAGFSETPDFLKVFQNEAYNPPWYEKKMLHWYDCTDWANNLYHCPTVAYSGEKDKQKQAADIMAAAMEKEGLSLKHIIGAGAGHQYTPAAKDEINRRIDAIASVGRDRDAEHIYFTTWTLRYNRMHWVIVDGMEEHWKRARVNVKSCGDELTVETDNVSALTLSMGAGRSLFPLRMQPTIKLDGNQLKAGNVQSDRSWEAHLRKIGDKWTVVPSADDGVLRKRHGLQGPIDDAFMDRFIMVRPTGTPYSDTTRQWFRDEMNHATEHWRRQFRGEAPVKDDTAITDADIASSNLILWGDPASNAVLAKIADKLPLRWTGKGISAAGKTIAPRYHVPAMIYPNPLNPKKYIVLNSGFTFREYDYLNNARQVPKLPDWAILDVTKPATSKYAAAVVDAGFFNERWELSK